MERSRKIVLVNLLVLLTLLCTDPAQGKPSGTSLIIITDVKVQQDDQKITLTLFFNGPLQDYQPFTLKGPNRIVIDVPKAKYEGPPLDGLVSASFPPVEKVRMGISREKVRLVIDLSSEKIPPYTTVKGENHLTIQMEIEKISDREKTVSEPVKERQQPLSVLEAKKETPALEEMVKESEVSSLKDSPLTWRKGDFTFGLKGYYKNMALGSKTVLEEDRYFLNLNPLRMDLTGSWKDAIVLKVVYDQEGFLGSYLNTKEFKRIKSVESHDIFDLDRKIADRKDFYWHHSLYRAYLRYQSEKLNVTVGRQRIAWGTGKFWNPTDIFNPFNPIQVERDERVGVDSVNAEFFPHPMRGINLVYAPQDSSARSKGALKFKATYKDWDVSLLGGKSLKDRVIGGDFAVNLFGGGLRGESIYYFTHEGKNYLQFIANYDYTFRNTFYILVEYFHNSGPLRKEEFLRLTDRGTHTLTRHQIGVNLGYDFTPLLRGDLYLIYGPKKSGIFVHPKVRYSLTQNLEVAGGVQWFNRRRGSEFEFDQNLFFIYAQYFF